MRFFLIFLFLFINSSVYASNSLENFLRFSIKTVEYGAMHPNPSNNQANKKPKKEFENKGYYLNIAGTNSYSYEGTTLGFGYYLDEYSKIELSFYDLYINGQDFEDYIKYDAFSIYGLNLTLYGYSNEKYLSIFRTFVKFGYGYFTQEYGQNTEHTPESVKALRFRSDINLFIGLGISAFIYDHLEIYTSANYTYFFDDPDYGETFEKNLFTIDYGLMIKF